MLSPSYISWTSKLIKQANLSLSARSEGKKERGREDYEGYIMEVSFTDNPYFSCECAKTLLFFLYFRKWDTCVVIGKIDLLKPFPSCRRKQTKLIVCTLDIQVIVFKYSKLKTLCIQSEGYHIRQHVYKNCTLISQIIRIFSVQEGRSDITNGIDM